MVLKIRRSFIGLVLTANLCAVAAALGDQPQQLPGASPNLSYIASGKWKVNDNSRPKPKKVAPKSEAALAASAQAPADAIILFDGKDLSAWKPSKWIVKDGYVEVAPKTGYLISKDGFGSCHLHLEWWTSNPPVGQLQMKGNSGVFLMSRYEVQVLDTYDNPTYADGIAGAIYGQTPPSVNPIRPPGHWQYYDITFHRPLFDAAKKLVKPATMTVDFNGVRVQDNTVVEGSTEHGHRHGYDAHPDKQPLQLQEHGCTVRFRNIWLEPIAD
jgi:Domain of Unknown Function (DUF1080)